MVTIDRLFRYIILVGSNIALRSTGLYKGFAASALVVILPHLNRGFQDKNIKGINEFLSSFLKERGLQLHCKRLNLQLIGADNLKSYASGSWSKGADSNVLMRFIP